MNKEVRYLPITDLLTEIIDNRGKSVPTVDSGFPLIATNCIKHSSIYPVFDKVRYVSEHTLKTWFRAHIKPNDILFVNKGTPGRVCLVPNPVTFCVAQDMMAFRSDPEKINYKYLFAVLRSNEIQKKIENNHVGLVIPHFRKQELSSLLIPIKSKQEQKAIGDLYISLSEKIELNNKINEELEAMAKTLYDYWFVQFDFPTPPSSTSGIVGKPYKSSGGKMVYNEELKREIPEGWEVKPINTKVTIGSGFPFNSDEYVDQGKYKIITIKNVQDGYLTTDSIDYTSQLPNNISDFCILQKGDILMSLTGNVGRMCMVDQDNLLLNQRVGKLLGDRNFVIYTYYFFKRPENINRLENIAGGSSQANLSPIQAVQNKYPIPPNQVLTEFVKLITSIINQILNKKYENQQLSSLRDWLLPMLMNGQVASRASATEE